MSITRLTTFVGCIALAICANGVAADEPDNHSDLSQTSSESASHWLNRMSHAVKETDYQGVLVFGNAHHWQTLTISHRVADGVEYEKILHLTGEPREVVRVGHETTCTHPGDRAVRGHRTPVGSIASALIERIPELGDYYTLDLGGQERIAGRDSQQLLVDPRDHHRYGHHLWLDQETGLLLRSDLVDPQGSVLERYQFAQIDIGKRLPFSEFEVSGPGHRISPHLATKSDTATDEVHRWRASWIPAGFRQASRQSGESDQALALMYTDGLAAFSIFVESVDSKPMPELVKRWGATSAIVITHTVESQVYRVTLVGELPLDTARRIALSVTTAPMAASDEVQ